MSVNKILNNPSKKVKAAFGLAIAEMVLDELKSDEEGYLIAKEALELSWQWIEKENVSGSTLAEYVDSPTEKDLGIREEFYDDNKVMISALVVLTIAIGLVARFAYELSGDRKMPTPIWETNEKSLYDLIDFASKTNLYNQEKVNRIIDFLISNHDTINQQKIDKNAILSFVTKN
jgi:hypothetical protein